MVSKPAYRTSKKALWLSSALAWLVILALTVGACLGSEQAVAFGTIAVPSMVAIIVGLLGVHRGFGSYDMRLAMREPRRHSPEERP
jgi:ABC-type xylose transport system permease subunit